MAKTSDLEFAQYVGPILRQVRKSRGKTLEAVAKETNIALGYLSRAERGQHALSMEKLSRLAEYYQVPLSHLIPKNDKYETKTLDLQKELWSAKQLIYDGETIQLTLEVVEQLEMAIRMGIAWAQKTQAKGKGS
ncbi:transcriptional regulator with XRE-family HTH domain [Brevibacillus aydinogluensis]|jgi:transcriptional regulator with XRE-family HTH domain|uniref:helix-turn-helix domain-containing protein n=1 Tax=Brevibacillus aydinogluensis TaxID=927786 RepID=UPI00289368DB|nr:helix-turn-helix transcriptional regulator [Brevibacillus aydinogluensis]MDT3418146.1 transcriptional regulator with XRE-family HTH domain [Brevibacillus aydinogluensis]